MTLKINERTKFFEPYGGTNYLYLARYNALAMAGIYSFLITSRAKSEITLAVGEREIRGEVVRGLAPAPTPTPTPTPTVVGYTMEQVKANNTAASCWSAIDAVVYNLTNWIPLHPGGSYLIQMLCGTDGSAALDAAAGEGGELLRVVVAAHLVVQGTDGAPELAHHDDEGFLQHAAGFQVGQESAVGVVERPPQAE